MQTYVIGSNFAGGFPTNSHEFSAQINMDLGRKLMRIAQKTPVNSFPAVHIFRASAQPWPRVPRGHGLNPTRKRSTSQEHMRPTPPATRPPGVPATALVNQNCHAPRPWPKAMAGYSVFVLQGPVHRALKLGNPETHPISPPATQEESLPFRPVENPHSRRNLHDPLRPSPTFGNTLG